MRNNALGYVAIGVAKATEIGGRVTADKVECGLRAGSGSETLGRLGRYSLLGIAIALLPMPPALAADDNHGQVVPIQSSTVPSNGDGNPYGVAFVPKDFPSGGGSQAR